MVGNKLNEFIDSWRGNSHEGWLNYDEQANDVPGSIRHIAVDIQKIMNTEEQSMSHKRNRVIAYCDHNFSTQDGEKLGEEFEQFVGKMFDDTVGNESSVKRAVQVTGAAVTKLVVGVIGLGVCIAGNALMVAGKALDAVTLGVVNKIPGLSSYVGRDLEDQNLIIKDNAKSYNGARLNQAQILGSHLANAGAKMMNLGDVAPGAEKKLNTRIAETVKSMDGKRSYNR